MENQINIADEYPYQELTEKILKCAEYVHKRIGNGFHEVVYKRPMACEFLFRNIAFEKEDDIIWSTGEQKAKDEADFLVDGKVMVELKSIVQFEEEHLTRTIECLQASNLEVGLLINFGGDKIDYKQILKTDYYPYNQ